MGVLCVRHGRRAGRPAQEAEGRGEAFAYNYTVREKLATSLALPAEEVRARIDRGDQWVIRFRMPENEVVEMDDLIRGHVEVNTSTLDDKVLYKSSDALPTYHLANIVDDHLMEVSHVIRGEEWLPSLPLHYLLYKAFGWTATQPAFAHLPLLLKPTGGGKLSKRDGDKMGFPVFPLFWKSPRRARPRTDTARTAISPRHLSTCWRCWGGTPAPSRRFSRCRS